MKRFKIGLIGVLTLSVTISTMPSMTFAEPSTNLAAAGISRTSPEIRASPEIKIPAASEKQPSTTSSHKWLWALLGLALLGGAAAAAGGGGGGGGGEDGGGGTPTGSVSGSW